MKHVTGQSRGAALSELLPLVVVALVAGGLAAFQMASIITALPFVLVMLVMCVSLYRALRDSPPQG